MTQASNRIDGWKAISAYMNRDPRTLQRWERERSLPVRRVQGEGSSSVYAFTDQLDDWLLGPGSGDDAHPVRLPTGPEPSTQPGTFRRNALIGLGALLIAGGVTSAFALRDHTSTVRAAPVMPADPEVAALYVQAREDWAQRTADGLHKAVAGFGTVVSRDPNFAPAYSGLADAYLLNREYDAMPDAKAYPQAEGAAKAALAIDPNSSDAQRAMGFIAYYWHRDIRAARNAFARARTLDPKNAQTHFWYGNALIDNGDFAAGLAELNTARLLDPESKAVQADYALALWASGQSASGMEKLLTFARDNPQSVSAHTYLAYAHLAARNFAGYLEESAIRAKLRDDPVLTQRIAGERAAFARGGATALIDTMIKTALATPNTGKPDSGWVAGLVALSGNRSRLITTLQAADARSEIWGVQGIVDHMFAAWKGDREVMALVARRRGESLADATMSRNGT
jgi:Tetratricopeptide repeat